MKLIFSFPDGLSASIVPGKDWVSEDDLLAEVLTLLYPVPEEPLYLPERLEPFHHLVELIKVDLGGELTSPEEDLPPIQSDPDVIY